MTPWKDIFSRRPVCKPDSESDGRQGAPSSDMRDGGLSDPAKLGPVTLGPRAPSSAEERWLGSYLRRAYDDVVAEPLPDSFDALLRQLQEDEGETVDVSSASSLTGSR
jgi:hypothetical protein